MHQQFVINKKELHNNKFSYISSNEQFNNLCNELDLINISDHLLYYKFDNYSIPVELYTRKCLSPFMLHMKSYIINDARLYICVFINKLILLYSNDKQLSGTIEIYNNDETYELLIHNDDLLHNYNTYPLIDQKLFVDLFDAKGYYEQISFVSHNKKIEFKKNCNVRHLPIFPDNYNTGCNLDENILLISDQNIYKIFNMIDIKYINDLMQRIQINSYYTIKTKSCILFIFERAHTETIIICYSDKKIMNVSIEHHFAISTIKFYLS